MSANAWKRIGLVLLKMIVLLFVISAVSFALVKLSPIDPIRAYIGDDLKISEEQKENIAEYWGLNDPPVKQYFKWLGNILHGDMGTSMIFHKPVLTVIKERFKLSLALMAVAFVMSGLFGFLLGLIAAVYKGKLIDKLIKGYCLILASSPAFWIGILLLLFFAVYLDLLPMGLAVPIGKAASEVTIGERIYHLILPSLALSLTGIHNIALQTREKLIEAMESDYALFAKSRGERAWTFVKRHGLRNILLPFVTLQFGSFSELFGGSVLAESVFSYPGLGEATTMAGTKGDITLLLGITLFSAVFVFTGNLIANLLYPVVDPRIREGGRIHD